MNLFNRGRFESYKKDLLAKFKTLKYLKYIDLIYAKGCSKNFFKYFSFVLFINIVISIIFNQRRLDIVVSCFGRRRNLAFVVSPSLGDPTYVPTPFCRRISSTWLAH